MLQLRECPSDDRDFDQSYNILPLHSAAIELVLCDLSRRVK